MNSTAAANSCFENATGSSRIVPSKAEGIALCTAFISACVFIAVGNMSTIILFAANIRLRKRSLFLVVNMAFADLMLGILSLPIYIYLVGKSYQLWNIGESMSLSIFFTIVDSFFMQASLISVAFISGERFYAIYWPFKHRKVPMRAYRIIIFYFFFYFLFFIFFILFFFIFNSIWLILSLTIKNAYPTYITYNAVLTLLTIQYDHLRC